MESIEQTAATQRPRYPLADNPLIEAVLTGLYRLPSEEMAQAELEQLRSHFTVSSQSPENSIILWIKNYEVTPKEAQQGCIGNYAVIYTEELPDGRWTVIARKVEAEAAYHPQRKRKQGRHPNWGHPLMRQVKKGKLFSAIEDARNLLMKIHEDFPEVTIPTLNKLYVMIYSRPKTGKASIQKYVLEVKVKEESGGFYIDAYENNYRAPAEFSAGGSEPATTEPPVGYFTSRVSLKRKRKNPGAS